MEYKDYYKILGLERNASTDEIKSAYRRLARKYHPDVSKEADAETRFKDVGEAYEVLKDAGKRQYYDQLGADWKAGTNGGAGRQSNWGKDGFGGFGGFNNSGGGYENVNAGDFSDFFEALFRGTNTRTRGANAHASANTRASNSTENQVIKLQIDLNDSLQGAKRSITLRTTNAIGSETTRTLSVNIPKGVKAGQKIRLQGQGNQGDDLLLEVDFLPNHLYKIIDGNNLQLKLPVTPWEAALGASIEAPLPTGGKAEIKIPPNSKSGTKLRLKGKGLPSSPAGDLYLVLDVVLPPADNERAKALYQQMAQELNFNPRSGL